MPCAASGVKGALKGRSGSIATSGGWGALPAGEVNMRNRGGDVGGKPGTNDGIDGDAKPTLEVQ